MTWSSGESRRIAGIRCSSFSHFSLILFLRVNGAVIKGFEEDVGTKISFYGFTTNTMKNALGLYRGDGFRKIPQSPVSPVRATGEALSGNTLKLLYSYSR